eukprot:411670-Rhodomonas_salina.2
MLAIPAMPARSPDLSPFRTMPDRRVHSSHGPQGYAFTPRGCCKPCPSLRSLCSECWQHASGDSGTEEQQQ